MGYDVAAIAMLELPAKKTAAWKRKKADASKLEDWPQPLNPADAPPATVKRVLDELQEQLAATACALRTKGGRVELAAMLPEHIFTDFGARLITAFRVAATLGASGRFDIVPFWTDGPALGFVIRPDGTRILRYSEAGIDEVSKSAPFRWIEQAMEGADEPLPSFGKKWLANVPEAAPEEGEARAPTSMGGHLIVSGRVGFRNKTNLRKWNREAVSPADVSMPGLGAYAGSFDAISPGDLEREIQAMDPPIAALRITLDPVEAWVKGAIPGDRVTTWAPPLIAAFEAAERFGGSGHLWLLPHDDTATGGLVLEVASDQTALRAATEADRSAASDDDLHREATQQFGFYLP